MGVLLTLFQRLFVTVGGLFSFAHFVIDHSNVVVCFRELSTEHLRPTIICHVPLYARQEEVECIFELLAILQVQKTSVKICFDVA